MTHGQLDLLHGNQNENQKQKIRNACRTKKTKLECGPMPNVMATLPNIGGALC